MRERDADEHCGGRGVRNRNRFSVIACNGWFDHELLRKDGVKASNSGGRWPRVAINTRASDPVCIL